VAYTESAIYIDSVAYTAVAAWAATHAYTVGQIVRGSASNRCNICITAGTSLSTEPTWSTGQGAKTTETGGPVWQECSAQPAPNGDSANSNSWLASQTPALGQFIKNVAATSYFICTTAGAGGTGAEPAWNTTAGSTTTDASAVWTCVGAISAFTARWAAPINSLNNVFQFTWTRNNGVTIFVGDDHNEGPWTTTWAYGLTTRLLSVDHTAAFPLTSANLKPGATFYSNNGTPFWYSTATGAFNSYVYGVTAYCGGNNGSVGNAQGSRVIFEQCVVGSGSANTNPYNYGLGDQNNCGGLITFRNCSLQCLGNAGHVFTLFGSVRLEGCSITGSIGGSANEIFGGSSQQVNAVIEGCDLSTNVVSSTPLVGPNNYDASVPFGYIVFKDCKLSSTMASVYRGGDSAMPDSLVIDLNRCDSGGAAYRNERHTSLATETTSTTVVRTGGAADGGVAVSHQVATSANAVNWMSVYNAIPLAVWNTVTGANRNVSIFGVANDTRVPTNAEAWFDVEYLGSSSTPQSSYARGGVLSLASPTALPADGSAWDTGAPLRANSTAYTVGQVIKTASNPGRVFFCITAGTSASSEPGYASAVDGVPVTDGAATFRAGCRFSMTLTLSSPQPGLAGYLYCYPKFSRPSMVYYLDPGIY
jgi:hypothetical protein